MFHTIYQVPTVYTTTSSVGGDNINSEKFPIRRGVFQGDITSPLYFILVLEFILRKYDVKQDKGVSFMVIMLHTLGYTDDVTLLEEGEVADVKRLSDRVTEISVGSKKDTDMSISIPKTMTLHVREQDKVSKTTTGEV